MVRAWDLDVDRRDRLAYDRPARDRPARDRQPLPLDLQAWRCYLDAIEEYHHHDLQVQTLADYDALVDRLGGSLFQILPDLEADGVEGARAFGAIDQCYNHLRDLHEDTQSGLCYFPQALLDRFGLRSADFFSPGIFEKSGYGQLMEFWLCEYLPLKRTAAEHFAARSDLSPTWRYLCDWSLDRYRRIEASLRRCNYDYCDFRRDYWGRVRNRLLGVAGGDRAIDTGGFSPR